MGSESERKTPTRLYSASWIDRFTRRVDLLPLPNWVFYLALWLFLFAIETLIHWSAGSYPVGEFYPFHLVLTGTLPYTLALIHHLDERAASALAKFRAALDIDDAAYDRLLYQLTTLPQRPTIIAGLLGVVVAALTLILAPDTWGRSAEFQAPEVSIVFNSILNILMWYVIGTFAYHTVHQLRLVSLIYARYTHINLFKLVPLYAFSNVSSRTTLGILFILYAWYAVLPNAFDRAGNVILAVVANVAAGLIFVWPLLGIHRLLVEQKNRHLGESTQRLETAINALHARFDNGKFEDMENLVKGMEGLEINHKAVARISTWPWQPETGRGLVAALLFPLILWLGQWVLTQLLGAS